MLMDERVNKLTCLALIAVAAVPLLSGLHRDRLSAYEPLDADESFDGGRHPWRRGRRAPPNPLTQAAAQALGSEPFLALMPDRIGEVAIQREHRVLHQRVDPEMEPLNGFFPSRDAIECGIELRQVSHFDHHVELAVDWRA
jgi:hypothetical protein